MLERHLILLSLQLANSSLLSTRVYWRKKIGIKEKYWEDTRSLLEILEEINRLKNAD